MALESSLLRHRSPSPSLSFSLSLSLFLLQLSFPCSFILLLLNRKTCWRKKNRDCSKKIASVSKNQSCRFFSWSENVPKKILFATGAKQDEKMLEISDNLTFWIGVANARFDVISFHRWVQLIESKSVKKRIITNCFLTSTKVHVARPEVFFPNSSPRKL